MKNYKIVILGGGPGGYVAAIRAAQLGASTAIIEKDQIGGTCLNRGCIPTKTLVRNAEILLQMRDCASRGINVGNIQIDMEQMIKNKENVIVTLRRGIEGLMKANCIDVYKGTGSVSAGQTITVENEQGIETISYENLIIATGSENSIPPIPGIDSSILTSTEILELAELPESIAIIGGGVIGCEFANIYNALGCKVTVIEMLPSLIANMDQDLSGQLRRIFKRKGIKTVTDSAVQSIVHETHGYILKIKDMKTGEIESITAEKVLLSAGRRANLEGLDALDLKKDRTYIAVDSSMRTNIDNIYAIGDVTGKIQLAHVASEQGIIAVENAMGYERSLDLSIVPSCIYTIPEIGSVGLTEADAREKYCNISIGKVPAAAIGKALTMGETDGFYKVIADGSGKILGVHIMGAGATDIVMEAAVVMKNGGTVDSIIDTIHAHPTMAEGIKEAALDTKGICLHIPPKKH